MIQTTSHLATFEADIQAMRGYLAENRSERPLHEVEAEIFAQVLKLGRGMLRRAGRFRRDRRVSYR
jgi:hypothetical protein